MEFINRQDFFCLSSVLSFNRTGSIDTVKSTFYFNSSNDLPFFIIDSASITSENNSRSSCGNPADQNQSYPHVWGIQNVLQKNSGWGKVVIRQVNIHVSLTNSTECSFISCGNVFWLNFDEINESMAKSRHMTSSTRIV